MPTRTRPTTSSRRSSAIPRSRDLRSGASPAPVPGASGWSWLRPVRSRGPRPPFPAALYPILVPSPGVAGYLTGCFDTAVAYVLTCAVVTSEPYPFQGGFGLSSRDENLPPQVGTEP